MWLTPVKIICPRYIIVILIANGSLIIYIQISLSFFGWGEYSTKRGNIARLFSFFPKQPSLTGENFFVCYIPPFCAIFPLLIFSIFLSLFIYYIFLSLSLFKKRYILLNISILLVNNNIYTIHLNVPFFVLSKYEYKKPKFYSYNLLLYKYIKTLKVKANKANSTFLICEHFYIYVENRKYLPKWDFSTKENGRFPF